MAVPLFLQNLDLALFIITLAGQSILISFSGFIAMKLFQKRSAPVRSLVSFAAITSLGLVLVASAGFYFSGISLYKKNLPLIAKENIETFQFPPEPDRAFTPEPVLLLSKAPILPDTERESGYTIFEAVPEPGGVAVPPYHLFINVSGLIWLAGIMFQLLKICHGLLRVNSFRKSISFRGDTPFPEIIRDIAGRFRKDCIKGIYTSSLINSPTVMGFINPVVVIPEKVFSTLSKNEMKSILLHEISHIYHHDLIVDIIKRAVQALHWWNPLVYLINRCHEQAREEVADNHVLQDLAPEEYSRCIMDLVEKVCLASDLPAASAMAGSRFNLRKRVEQILSKKRSMAMGTKLHLKVTGFAICIILTFGIAGLHARGSAVKNVDAVREVQEPPQAIGSVSLIKEAQNLSLEKTPEPEAVDEADMPQSIPKPVTTPRKELPVKQVRKNEKPVMVMASADTKAIKETEKLLGSVGVRREDVSALKKEKSKTIVLTQHKTAEKEDSKTIDVPDNMVQNDRSENIEDNTQKKDIDTAIAELSRQMELNDSDAGLYVLRGNLHMDKQDYGQAVNDYTKAIEINPDDAAAYNNRGQAYVNMWEEYNHNKWRQAFANTGKYNSREEFQVVMKEAMKDTEQADKYYKTAIKDYKKAIKKDPENIYSYINRGNAYYAKGQYRKAISDYTKAIKIDPQVSLAYINRGITYLQKRSSSNAIKDFSKAIELDAGDVRTYLLRGNAYHSKREYRQAINDYSKALEINPGLISVYNNRGIAYEGMGELDKAILEYSRAIDIISEKPDVFINPNSLSKEGQGFSAVTLYSHYRGSNIYHNSFSNNYKVTEIYGGRQGYRDSLYGYGVRYNPGTYTLMYVSPLSHYMDIEALASYINRGLAYEKKNQLDKSISDLSRVVEIYPNHTLAYLYRAEIYRKMGNEVEYKNDLNMAKKYGYKSELTKEYLTPGGKGYWEGSPTGDFYYQITKDQYLDNTDSTRAMEDAKKLIRAQKNNYGNK